MKTKLLPIKTVCVATPAYILAIALLSAGLASAQDCLILKRMGPADQITSHMYSFGIRGKQFQYVEGALPKGIKFHGRLTDHDVRKIQDAGGRFVVLEPKFTGADLAEARRGCIANYSQAAPEKPEVSNAASSAPVASNQVVRKEPDVVVAQPAPIPPVPTVAPQPSVRPAVLTTDDHPVDDHRPMEDHRPASPANSATVSASAEGTVSITSDTEGAEIFVDSVGRGHAPTIIKLPAGRHSVQLVSAGHKDWVSEIELKGDSIVNVSAVFQAKQ
jgi:hypothetical protein